MLAAAVDAVAELGYARMTVAEVIGRARVSRKTFYDVFRDREDCFLAAFEHGLEQAGLAAGDAYEAADEWRTGVRGGLAAVLLLMDEEPALAKLCLVDALAAGERVLERRAHILRRLAQVIDRGRDAPGAAGDPPTVTAEGLVGAIASVLHARLLDGSEQSLTDLHGSLMSMIVLPYLGAGAATEELERQPLEHPALRPDGGPAGSREDPLKSLNMRLTYRTVRVLSVIARHPGASNREIAEDSGIADQGQISKLLNRLARLDLVENRGAGQERGAANAWHLSVRGAQVERATRPR